MKIIIKHLPGKHSQQSHDPGKGGSSGGRVVDPKNVTVKVFYDGKHKRTVKGVDLSKEVEYIKKRNARTNYQQSERGMVQEAASKIYGADFDATDSEQNRWRVEIK